MTHETPVPNPITVPDYIAQGYAEVPSGSKYLTRLTKTNDDKTVHTVDVGPNGTVEADTTIARIRKSFTSSCPTKMTSISVPNSTSGRTSTTSTDRTAPSMEKRLTRRSGKSHNPQTKVSRKFVDLTGTAAMNRTITSALLAVTLTIGSGGVLQMFFVSTSNAESSASSYDGEVRIELATCRPNGIYNSWKEKISPKSFWLNQVVGLEREYEDFRARGSPAERCSGESDQKEKIRCVLYFQNLGASMGRCLQAALRMCRANGSCLDD